MKGLKRRVRDVCVRDMCSTCCLSRTLGGRLVQGDFFQHTASAAVTVVDWPALSYGQSTVFKSERRENLEEKKQE